MTKLERHCQLLLRAYPAAYRRERATEMLGTLVETTPAGRTWPLPRDSRALLLGGLRTRSAQNRRLGTPACLRLSALLGCALILAFAAVNYASYGVVFDPHARSGGMHWQLSWRPLTVAMLILTAAVLPWLASRRVVILGAVAAGAATVAYDQSSRFPWHWIPPHSAPVVAAAAIAEVLLPLAALVVLSGRAERPPRLWLWLPGLLTALAVLADFQVESQFVSGWLAGQPGFNGPDPHLWLAGQAAFDAPDPYLWLVPFGLAVAWIAIDARPVIGLIAYSALWLAQTLFNWFYVGAVNFNWGAPGQANWWVPSLSANWWGDSWKWLAAGLMLSLLALWRVRRQAVL